MVRMNAVGAANPAGIASEWLETAERTFAFIDSLANDDGTLWAFSVDQPDRFEHGFYRGSAGILLFLIELAAATGRTDLPDRIRRSGEELLRWTAEQQDLSCNLPLGWSGLAFSLSCLGKALGDARYDEEAARCIRQLRLAARPLGQGLGWIEPMPFADITGISDDAEVVDLSIGAGGGLLALLWAHATGLDPDALDTARGVGDRLIEIADRTNDGLNWSMVKDMPFPFPAPNFAHGSSGMAFGLAQLAQLSGDQKYLDAAIEGMTYTLAHATDQPTGGKLVCHLETEPGRYYLSVCHGPPGTCRALLRLYDITQDHRWLAALRDLMRGLTGTGAPEQRSEGLWGNYGQCCGDAGIGDFALLLGRRGLWDEGLSYAERCGKSLLKQASRDGQGTYWAMAEHRKRPDFIQTQTGYMQGAAGIGSFLVHLGTQIEGRAVGLYPLDWPHANLMGANDPHVAGA